MIALQSLVAATRLLGIPQSVDTEIVRDVVRSFVDQVKSLAGWNRMSDECAVQAAVDVGFLVLLSGGDISSDSLVKELLVKVSHLTPSCSIVADLSLLRPRYQKPFRAYWQITFARRNSYYIPSSAIYRPQRLPTPQATLVRPASQITYVLARLQSVNLGVRLLLSNLARDLGCCPSLYSL